MGTLRVINPVARSIKPIVDAAPRVETLDGKRVGLYWNMKHGGDIGLHRIETLLQARYPQAKFSHHIGDVGSMVRFVSAGGAARLAKEIDVVVGTTAD